MQTRRGLSLLIAILLMPRAAVAQSVSVAIKGGIPLTEAFETGSAATATAPAMQVSYTSRAKPYTFGPAVEISLPLGLALEFDALYKRLNYNFTMSRLIPVNAPGLPVPGVLLIEQKHNIISRWELPLLVKYRLRSIDAYRLYFSAGLNTNYIVNTTESGIGIARFGGGPVPLPPPITDHNPPSELRYRSAEGVVVAGGLEFHYHRVRLAPELRYTRWAHGNFQGAIPGTFRSELNQAEILFALGW